MRQWLAWAGAVAALVGAPTAQAVTDKLFDFNSDPSGVLNTYGNAEWRSEGGNPASGGYLVITDAINSQGGIIVFDDFDNGLVVKGFNFKVDLRIGNPTGNDGRPADGFSVNFARQNDPIIVKADAGQTPDGYADSAGAHEFGTKTGIAVDFDTWSGNTLPDSADIEGLIVRMDNKTLTRVAMPTRNGACDDPTSLQTGPYNADLAGAVDELCWKQLEVDLDAAGLLTVKWKAATILDKYQTTFAPSRGRIVFMGRTGGANQNNHVDNIRITTIPASTAIVSGVEHTPTAVTVVIDDAPGSEVVPSSVKLKVDGASVTATVSKTGSVTKATYTPATPFPSGTTHSVEATYADANKSYTETRSFTTEVYGTLVAAMKATSADTTKAGFRIRPHQVQQTTTILENTIARAESQLAGGQGANGIDLASIGADAQGFVNVDGTLNLGNSGGAGEFADTVGLDTLGMPGLGTDGSQLANENNSAMEILTFVQFPSAGFYRLGVRSDDGFRLQSELNPRDMFAVRLGQYDGGRGMDPGTEFWVEVKDAGVYPMRMVWENGDGGAGVEWYSVQADGKHVLLNDTATAGALKAYRVATVATQPYVTSVYPGVGATGVHPQPEVAIAFGDAGSIDQATLQVTLDGSPLTVSKTSSGTQLTVKAPVTTVLPSSSQHQLALSYTASGKAVTRTWSFTTAPYSVTLPSDIAGDPGSGNTAGFRVKIYQLDIPAGATDTTLRQANNIEWAEGVLTGKVAPNSADLTGFGADGYYLESGTINYNQPNDAGDGLESNGNFVPDKKIPGIPGKGDPAAARDNIVGEFLTYVEFPTAGAYMMGVNSDDGFRVTAATGVGSAPVTVLAPAAAAGQVPAALSVRDLNAALGGPLPATEIVTDALMTAPADACADLTNASALAGKIAIIDRGTCTFIDKIKRAQAAGAVAVLIVNNRSDYPILMGGDDPSITVPSFMIPQNVGDTLKANLTGLRMRVGRETAPMLGEFNGNGRGSSDTIFTFIVPKAGVYPMRCLWQEGGGGANVEWFSVATDGTKVLLNDTASPKALKAFEKATVVAKPTVSIAASGSNVTVTYSAGSTLQSAATVNGPWTDVTGATSPYTTA
ncbi:MAG: hypothetical protein K1X57_21820, partial [Gemmataceae bacterium]|nr:hypothetical protein [Gemmataceae bacterium]